MVQICLASVAAWLVATEVIGHVQPFFAPVAAVVTVTAGLGQRHRVVVELVIGVAVGILVGELLIGLIGRGTWQLALVVALAALSAALLRRRPARGRAGQHVGDPDRDRAAVGRLHRVAARSTGSSTHSSAACSG